MKSMKNINQVLPLEITSDILTRIPTESVLESKLVCKTWRNLIQHPSFPKLHLDRLNSADSTGKLTFVMSHLDDYYKNVYYFEFNENEDWNYVKPIPRNIGIEIPFESHILMGSFNGLICFYGFQPDELDGIQGPAMIFNPVTREYVILPEPEYDQTKGSKSVLRYFGACGFGYVAETNEYKVVRMYTVGGDPYSLEVEVYTVGSGKGWRHVGKFDFGFIFFPTFEQTHGVFLNGCLHWRNGEGGMVVVFDLARERFREHIPPPPLLTGTDDDEDFGCNIVMGVSGGGFLYYAVGQSVEGNQFDDVWLLVEKNDNRVMKEQVVHRSQGWSKLTSLDQREPFAFMRGGSVLRYDQCNIQNFISATSTWENYTDFHGISRQVFPYKHTLVSLKELGEEDAEIMEPRI